MKNWCRMKGIEKAGLSTSDSMGHSLGRFEKEPSGTELVPRPGMKP